MINKKKNATINPQIHRTPSKNQIENQKRRTTEGKIKLHQFMVIFIQRDKTISFSEEKKPE